MLSKRSRWFYESSTIGVRNALIALALGLAVTLAPPAHAGKTGKRLLAGVAAVAVVVGDPLERHRDYKAPKQPTHVLQSDSGNLLAPVEGAFLCFAEAKAEQNIYGADRAGAIFYHSGDVFFVPMWAYGRGGGLLPAKFQIYSASQNDAGLFQNEAMLDPTRDDLWDCWSSKTWRW